MKLKNGMVIKCNSEEEAKEFIKEAYKQGFEWFLTIYGNEEKTFWDTCCSEIYYYLEDNLITYSIRDFSNYSIDYSTLKVKKDIMTKSDLKNGMVVELASGSRALVINGLLLFEDSYQGLSAYKDDLTTKIFNNEFQINKVFKSKLYNLCDVLTDDLSLIWEREEKEEIKVGDKVKVINNGYCFDEYYDWVKENINNRELKLKFDYGNVLSNGTICEVLHINKHNGSYNTDDTLAYIQDMENKRCYLINIEGLEKID